jgi:tetratricopeptide (TPR) repeat protein
MDRDQLQFQTAVSAYREGDYWKTVANCDDLLGRLGPQLELLNLKAIALLHAKMFLAAASCIEQALELNSENAMVHSHAGRIYSKLHRPDRAISHAEEACALDPGKLEYQLRLGEICRALGEYERAISVAESCIEKLPGCVDAWSLKAGIHTDLGDWDSAIAALEKLIQLQPGDAQALHELSQMKKSMPADANVMAQLEAIRDGSVSAGERHRAIFALADACARDDRFSQAFDLYQEANNVASAERPASLAGYAELAHHILENATVRPDLPSAGQEDQHEGEADYVFIIGMPRSGTSLCEQIVSAHPEVLGCGELDCVEQIRKHLEYRHIDPFVPQPAESDGDDYLPGLREDYRSCLPADRAEYRYITDKSPQNFRYAGLILQMFPRARFLYCIRHPLDTILSCFVHGYSYAIGLEETARSYVIHVEFMRHWRSLVPDKIHDVHYSKLVLGIEAESRGIADFLGIEWHPAMAEPHLNPRAVTTPSKQQVRQPVYTTALDHWKNYREQLESVIAYLQQQGVLDENIQGPIM